MNGQKHHGVLIATALFAATTWLGAVTEVAAERIVVYPTRPGSNYRDCSQPGYIIEKDSSGRTTVYPTRPGTNYRDISKPGYVIEEERDFLELPSLELPELPSL